MKLKLTAWQRFQCIQMIGSLRGNVSILHLGGKLLDILDFTDEDKKRVGYQDVGPNQVIWTDTKAKFDVEIVDKNQIDFFKRTIKQCDTWPIANSDQIFDLFEQAGVEIPEE